MAFRDELLKLAEAMAAADPRVLRLAHNEQDASTEKVPDAAHFLKIDGRRIGRDIELYGFMGSIYKLGGGGDDGDWNALVDFAAEIVLPLKQAAPAAYAVAADRLKTFGEEYLDADQAAKWAAMFEIEPASPAP